MPNAAVAARTYESLVSQADPLRYFMAGQQAQMHLKAAQAATQAGILDATFRSVELMDKRQQQEQKNALVKMELDIAAFNAQTNRMNAERALTRGTGSGTTTGGFNLLDALGSDERGLYLDPTRLGGGAPAAEPTGTGEGDVTPLQPDAPTMPVLPAPAAPGGLSLPLPTTQSGATPTSPLLPTPTGGTPPGQSSQPAAPTQTASNPGRLRLSGVTVGATGRPSFRFEAEKPGEGPQAQVTPEYLDGLNAKYDHLGVMAVPKAGKAGSGVTEFEFVQKPSARGADFSISGLTGEAQKPFIESVNSMLDVAKDVENPSDAAKMRAAGIDPADKNAAKLMLERGLWDDSYVAAKKEKENELFGLADAHAKKLNNLFRGKSGYVPTTALEVLRDIGISSVAPRAAQPAAAAPQAAPGPVPQPSPTGTAGPTVADAQLASNQARVEKARTDLAAAKTPEARAQAQAHLKEMEGQLSDVQKKGGSAPAPKAAAPAEDPWSAPAKEAPPAAKKAANPKEEASNQQWEGAKTNVVRAMKGSLTQDQIDDLAQSTPSADPEHGGGGEHKFEKRKRWLEANKDKLGIEPLDGKPLTMESPVFVDKDGRTVRMAQVISAVFEDPRFQKGKQASRVEKGKGDLSPSAKAVLDKALSN